MLFFSITCFLLNVITSNTNLKNSNYCYVSNKLYKRFAGLACITPDPEMFPV